MQSTSIPYLVFLGLIFALYWAVHRHQVARLGVLLIASLYFYMVWTPFPVLVFFWVRGGGPPDRPGAGALRSPRGCARRW